MDADNAASEAGNHSPGWLPDKVEHSPVADALLEQACRRVLTRLVSCREEVTAPTWSEFVGLLRQLDGFRNNYTRAGRTSAGQLTLEKHLAFAMLVPGGKAERARTAVLKLEEAGLFWTGATPWSDIPVANIIKPYARFHNVKAKRLISALVRVRGQWFRDRFLVQGPPSRDCLEAAHDYLEQIDGLGPKATAHFMRNVGLFSDEFAYPIIDVHIHKLLEAFNFKHADYEQAEESFYTLSAVTGVPVIILDAYVWCAYSGNWGSGKADFDNFAPEGD